MKRKLLLPLLVILFFISCEKSSTNDAPTTSTNTITATESGVRTTYTNASASNGLSSFSGNYVLNVTSFAFFPNTIELVVSSATPLEAKTYTNTTLETPFYIFYGSYKTHDVMNNGTVTITSIDSVNVKGTFSGDVYLSGTKKSLTNGSFNVEF